MLCINSVFTQDAGCPIFPMEFVEELARVKERKNFEFQDINLELYEALGDYKKYALLKCICGGYEWDYYKCKNISSSTFRFEALQTVNLLVAILHCDCIRDEWIQEECSFVANEYGMRVDEVLQLVYEVDEIFDDMALEICESEILLFLPSVASVFAGLWFASKIKRSPTSKIIVMGNQINIPEVADFSIQTKIVDEIINSNSCNIEKAEDVIYILERIKPLIRLYPLYYGLRIIPFKISEGCMGKCNFCTERMSWDISGKVIDRYYIKKTEECKKILKYLINEYEISGITLNDCTINLDIESSIKVLEYLKEKNMFLSGSLRIDFLDNRATQKLEELNVTNLIIGLETLNLNNVKTYNKGKDNYLNNALNIVPKLIDHGIIPQINFIFDHPYENEEEVQRSINEALKYGEYLIQNEMYLNNINIGDILINYPSENYFRVLEDKNFTIYYHTIDAQYEHRIDKYVLNAIKRIPYKAENGNGCLKKNKLLRGMSKFLIKDQKKRVSCILKAMMHHWKMFYSEWERKNCSIEICVGNTEFSKIDNVLAKLIFEKGVCQFNDIKHFFQDKEKSLVETILIMALLNIVKVER